MKQFILKIENEKNALKFGAVAELLKKLNDYVNSLDIIWSEREYSALVTSFEWIEDQVEPWIEIPGNEKAVIYGKAGSHIFIHDVELGNRVSMLWMEEIK